MRVARLRNDTLPIVNKVPVEIICRVFSFLSLGDCIQVSHVCSHFRRVALDCSILWTTLHFGDAFPCSSGPELLARTRGAPVKLSIRRHGRRDLFDCLSQHMNHILFLDIDVAVCDEDDVVVAFRLPAPMLQTLHIADHPDDRSIKPRLLSLALLCGLNAPSLRHLWLEGLNLSSMPKEGPVGLHLPTVRVLIYTDIASIHDLARARDVWPTLDSLAISVIEPLFAAGPMLHTISQHKPVPHLEYWSSNYYAEEVFRVLDCYLIPTVSVQTSLGAQRIRSILQSVQQVAITIERHSLHPCVTVSGRGVKRAIFLTDTINVIDCLSTVSFATLVTLTIHETVWPVHEALPVAPCLLHLAVILTSQDQYADIIRGHSNPGIFFLQRGPSFCTPALLTVCLTCWSHPIHGTYCRLVVSAGDVAIFVSSALLTPLGRPPALVLRGVDLLKSSQTDAYQALTRITSSLDVSPDPLKTFPQVNRIAEEYFGRPVSYY